MNRRIYANVGFFVVIAVVLAVWSVQNVLTFDVFTRPFKVTASFASAPGINTNSEVTYLGQKVGHVAAIHLEQGRVDIVLKMERGIDIPRDVSAGARRQSAVGEPYIELTPLPGTDANTGPRLARNDVIPIERTSIPLSYSELFRALDDLVKSVQPQDLDTLVHELAVGLDGRAGDIRLLLDSANQLTATLASHEDDLDAALTALTQLTHTLATHSDAIAASTDHLATLAAGLADSRQTIEQILNDGPGFAAKVVEIVSKSQGNLGCLVDALGAVSSQLDDKQLAAGLARTIGTGPQLKVILSAIRDKQPDGTYVRGPVIFNAGGTAGDVPINNPPLADPKVPAIPVCTQTGIEAPGAGGSSSVAGQGTQAQPGPGAASIPSTPTPEKAAPAPAPASSEKHVADQSLSWLAFVLLGVIVLLVLAARPWRILGLARRGGDGGQT